MLLGLNVACPFNMAMSVTVCWWRYLCNAGFISYSPPGDYFQDMYGERGDERDHVQCHVFAHF
jgi:hypothetical protein